MDFICITLDGMQRWVRIDQIAALEDEGQQTIIYLVNNANVHIACDQSIDDVLGMITDAQSADDELNDLEESIPRKD